jgi:hypothetical protein
MVLCAASWIGLLACAHADSPTSDAAASAADAQKPAPKGSFFSSLKQAFSQDFDREVVRGHFEVGAAPDSHRYYCLIDPKTGKREANGVAGEPFKRPDGMTGIKSGAVTFYSCADAETQGNLTTSGYTLTTGVEAKVNAAAAAATVRAAPTAPVAPAAPIAASAPVAPVTANATTAPAAPSATAAAASGVPGSVAAAADPSVQRDVLALFGRFVTAQNAHNRALVADGLLDSKDFVWAQYGGNSVWGRDQAMAAFEESWQGSWKLEPQLKESRIASVAPGAAVLITPLLFTQGGPGEPASTAPVRWSGFFVRTPAGWRIAAIIITPFKNWRPPDGN